MIDFGLDQARFYLDGSLVSTKTMTKSQIADTAGALVFGAYHSGSEFFNGYLDEVAIWDQVIPDTSIQALANGGSPLDVAVPEPSTLAMLLGLAGVALLGCRRRWRPA
jgi:hypothetical protein